MNNGVESLMRTQVPAPRRAQPVPVVELGSAEGDVGIGVEPPFLLHVALCFLLRETESAKSVGFPFHPFPDLTDPTSFLPFILCLRWCEDFL